MNWELFLALGGFGTITTVLTFMFTVRYVKRKERATAGQEEAREKQEDTKAKKDLADLERDIYERIVSTLQEQFDSQNKIIEKQSKEIKTLKETQDQLQFTVKLQNEQIEILQGTVDEYKATCDNCQFRMEKVTLRKTK